MEREDKIQKILERHAWMEIYRTIQEAIVVILSLTMQVKVKVALGQPVEGQYFHVM